MELLHLRKVHVVIFFRHHSEENTTPAEVKREVVKHLKEKQSLEQSLPSSIIIGPFSVSVKAVRESLSKKRSALAKAVLDSLALKLHKQLDEARLTCSSLQHRLTPL